MAELFRQVRQEVFQAEGRAWLAVAAHCHYFSQLVVQRGVDGADGVFPAKERLTSYKEEEENHETWLQRPLLLETGMALALRQPR